MKTYSKTILTAAFMLCFSASGLAADLMEGFKLTGDFRYRHEYFDQKGLDEFNRHQVRARLNLQAKVTTGVNFIIQAATGENDAPFSTDQTLNGSFSTKSLWLDQVYVNWQPKNMDGLVVSAGKMPNPLRRVGDNQLMWNPEVFPEGLSAQFASSNEGPRFFASASSFWMEQRAQGENSYLIATQGGIDYLGSEFGLVAGLGYVGFTNAKGNVPYYNLGGFGNTLDAAGAYANDFNIVEAFAQISTRNISIPIAVYADFALNNGANTANQAYLIGFSLGKNDKPMTWAFNYNYIQIERDALIGVLNDPDFAGGATDVKGSKMNLALRLTDKTTTDLTAILSDMSIDNGGKYNRIQWAFNFVF
jgi:hypothetical protein